MRCAAQPRDELLGKKGNSHHEIPRCRAGLVDGDLAFRQHASGHSVASDRRDLFNRGSKRRAPSAERLTLLVDAYVVDLESRRERRRGWIATVRAADGQVHDDVVRLLEWIPTLGVVVHRRA